MSTYVEMIQISSKAISTLLTVWMLSSCFTQKPFQPPPHPAQLWMKDGYALNGIYEEMRICGWKEPRENLNAARKIDMDLYAQVDRCMLGKGFNYIGRTPLTCAQPENQYLPNCKDVAKNIRGG